MRKDSPGGFKGEHGPDELDLGLPVSRSVKQPVSGVLKYPFCRALLQQPQEANSLAKLYPSFVLPNRDPLEREQNILS